MSSIFILAQAGADSESTTITTQPISTEEITTQTAFPTDPNAGAPAKRPPKSPLMTFLPFILIFVVFYFLLFRGPRRKQKKQKQMISNIQKNDKIRTIGGILGTVVDINGEEITIKVDESNNTKIKILSSAIGRNLSKEQK